MKVMKIMKHKIVYEKNGNEGGKKAEINDRTENECR